MMEGTDTTPRKKKRDSLGNTGGGGGEERKHRKHTHKKHRATSVTESMDVVGSGGVAPHLKGAALESAQAALFAQPVPRLNGAALESAQSALFAQLRGFITNALNEFLAQSPFESIADMIGPAHYDGFSTLLIDDVLVQCGPYYGVHLAIHTMLEQLRAMAIEVTTVLGRKYECGRHFKKRKPLVLTYKHVLRPSCDFAAVREDPELAAEQEAWVRELVHYDRDTRFIEAYERRESSHIAVLQARLGTYQEPLLSVLMPCEARDYQLTLHGNRYLVDQLAQAQTISQLGLQLRQAQDELALLKAPRQRQQITRPLPDEFDCDAL